MKKFLTSIILSIFMINVFYPVIYATENIVLNQTQEENTIINDIQEENTIVNEIEENKNENTIENTTIENENDKSEDDNTINEQNVVEDEIIDNKVESTNTINTENNKKSSTEPIKKNVIVTEKVEEVNVGNKSYTGLICIDTPINNQSCVIPDSNIINLSGWAVSDDEQSVLKLYVNNVYWTNISRTTARGDVNKIFPQYAKTTKKAGYSYKLNISQFPECAHEIRVDQVSRYGKVISSSKVIIRVSKRVYKGVMCIDTPINNQAYTLPNTNIINLSGWAVSDDEQSVLKLYVNNVYWTNISRTTARGDVNKIFSQYAKTTKKAGYSYKLNISQFPECAHEIRVDQVSRYGKVISSSKVIIRVSKKVYSGVMCIDTPINNQAYTLPNTNIINLSGWAVSDDEQSVLKLYVNNVYWTNISRTTARGDVNKIFPQYAKTTKKAGYSYKLNISQFPECAHEIRVDQVSRYGKVISSSRVIIRVSKKVYSGVMCIDTPINNQSCVIPDSNIINLSGWAVSDDEQSVLKLYVNNVYWTNISRTTARGDVNKIFPQYAKTTKKAGYSYKLNISQFPECAHEIRVDQVSRYGKLISRSIVIIRVNQRAYSGLMCIDTPVNNQAYTLPNTNIINLSGWAVSDDEQSVLKLYVNNVYWTNISRTTARGDVNKIFPQYAKTTKKAGYTYRLNISQFPECAHEIRVDQVSRYGKIISSSKVIIYTVTPNYKGIMCIDAPIQNKRYKSGALEVSGWILSESPTDYVSIFLDGTYVKNADRIARQDVLNIFQNQYGGKTCNPKPGFYSVINTANLGEGMHSILVVNYSKYWKQIQYLEVKFIISNTLTWGIDVSHYQGSINWSKVRNDGVNFAILKIGEYRESSGRILVDDHFEEYYKECKRNGIQVGGYFYSYAFNEAEASHEASACLSVIRGKSFDLPIFMDIEDHIVTDAVNDGRTGRTRLTNAVIKFCSKMNANGYESGVYSYRNFFYNYLYMSSLENYNVWLAHYVSATDYTGKYDIWQYTSSGHVSGIHGNVDLNWCFKRF